MLKKITLWILYAAFVGVLVYGAINRTVLKIEENDEVQHGNAVERDHGSMENNESAGQDTPDYEWATLTGTVSSILPRGMVVAVSDGQHIEVARRTWRYALEQGFAANVGDQVALDGFYGNGNFEVAKITNLTLGQIVYLRDESEHPLWASGDH